MIDTDTLIHEFGSLDSSLILAIASESDDLQAVRTTLKALAATDSLTHAPDSDGESLTSGILSRTESNATTSDVERALEDWSISNGGSVASATSSDAGDEDTSSPYDANIVFLESMYPSRDTFFLKNLLEEHDGNVETVLDHLLSIEYIDGEAPLQLATSGHATLVNEHRKRKRRRPPKSTKTFSLTDTGRLPASPSTSNASLPIQSDNLWVNVDSVASHIATLLNLSPGFVTSIYHKKSSSFALALDTLLDTLELQHPYDSLSLDPNVISSLQAMFSPQDPSSELAVPERQWRKYLCATQGNIESSIDLMLLQQEIVGREGSALEVGLLKGFDSAVAKSSREQFAVQKDLDAVANGVLRPDLPGWSASSKASGNKPILYTPTLKPKPGATPIGLLKGRVTEATLSDNPTAAECSAMAEEYRNNRNEAFKAAARHFQSGKSGGERGAGDRGAAAYWSEKGRELDARARSWDLRSARAQVAERRVVADNSIDLHNLTVNQALTVVKENVNTWWSSSSNPRPFRIVTGAGRHSANRMPVLLPSVMKMLDREGWRVRKDPDGGSLIVTGVKNSGRVMGS